MDTGASLYDCKVYSCLASRLVVGPVKVLLTSGGAGVIMMRPRYAGSLQSWVVHPKAWVRDHY